VDREREDLWTCPRCGARFVTRNMPHGCGEYPVDGFFEGKPAIECGETGASCVTCG
jgi:hypothetical protein